MKWFRLFFLPSVGTPYTYRGHTGETSSTVAQLALWQKRLSRWCLNSVHNEVPVGGRNLLWVYPFFSPTQQICGGFRRKARQNHHHQTILSTVCSWADKLGTSASPCRFHNRTSTSSALNSSSSQSSSRNPNSRTVGRDSPAPSAAVGLLAPQSKNIRRLTPPRSTRLCLPLPSIVSRTCMAS